jgi:hypothetical protein
VGKGEVTLALRAQLLEGRVAPGKAGLVALELRGPALRLHTGRHAARGGRLLGLCLSTQLRYQDVRDRHDDRPAYGEQAGIEQGEPSTDCQLGTGHMR